VQVQTTRTLLLVAAPPMVPPIGNDAVPGIPRHPRGSVGTGPDRSCGARSGRIGCVSKPRAQQRLERFISDHPSGATSRFPSTINKARETSTCTLRLAPCN